MIVDLTLSGEAFLRKKGQKNRPEAFASGQMVEFIVFFGSIRERLAAFRLWAGIWMRPS